MPSEEDRKCYLLTAKLPHFEPLTSTEEARKKWLSSTFAEVFVRSGLMRVYKQQGNASGLVGSCPRTVQRWPGSRAHYNDCGCTVSTTRSCTTLEQAQLPRLFNGATGTPQLLVFTTTKMTPASVPTSTDSRFRTFQGTLKASSPISASGTLLRLPIRE
jgi:hypothetical protein